MNLFLVIGKISRVEKGMKYDNIHISLLNPYYNGDFSQPLNYILPIKVNKLIFKDELMLLKRNLSVAIKGRIEFTENLLSLVCEKIKFI